MVRDLREWHLQLKNAVELNRAELDGRHLENEEANESILQRIEQVPSTLNFELGDSSSLVEMKTDIEKRYGATFVILPKFSFHSN
jgi:flagellar motor switch/type III secretory pathway protein FliN